MTDSSGGGQNQDPFGGPPTGPDDYPDPSGQQSSFPEPPDQFPPPGQQPPPVPAPPPGQYPPPGQGQFAPPGQGQFAPPGQSPPHASPFEPPAQQQYPPVGYNQGPNQYPNTPPQKKRRIWPWLLLGIPLLFAVLIGGCSLLFFGAVRGPIDATNAYVAHLDNRDFGAAYDSLCSRSQTATARDVWIAEAEAEIDGEITGFSFSQVEISGDAVVTGTIDIDSVSRTSVFNLVEEGGEWRVCE